MSDCGEKETEAFRSRVTYINLHFFVQSIVHDEVVCHSNTMGLHGMALSIIVVADITCRRRMRSLHKNVV